MSFSEIPRYPSYKISSRGFAVNTGSGDAVLAQVGDAEELLVIEGIDVYATESGVGSEQFTIDMRNVSPNLFIGTIFGNQVSPNTSLNFEWRGSWPLHSNEQLVLHSVAGVWAASYFGFSTAADNVVHT